MADNPFRNLPSVNDILELPAVGALAGNHSHEGIVAAIRDELANLRDSRPGPELASIEDGRSRIVQKAMAQLSRDQREAIELAYFSGLSHTEVAAQTDLPLGTVKTRIRLGMLNLRKLLEPYAEGL